MKHDEAKFLLRARRPGTRDAADPMFAEALAEAARDPLLRAWHEAEQRFDSAVAGKLGDIAPPAGLREAILAGSRASRGPARGWARYPARLALAAAVVLGTAVATWKWSSGAGRASAGELATVALRDLAEAHAAHDGQPAGLATVQARLAEPGRALASNVSVDLDELRRASCRALTVGGREVFEICFQRQGVWYHLYATRGRWGDAALHEVSRGRMVAATWSDRVNSYAVVTEAGREALRRVL